MNFGALVRDLSITKLRIILTQPLHILYYKENEGMMKNFSSFGDQPISLQSNLLYYEYKKRIRGLSGSFPEINYAITAPLKHTYMKNTL